MRETTNRITATAMERNAILHNRAQLLRPWWAREMILGANGLPIGLPQGWKEQ